MELKEEKATDYTTYTVAELKSLAENKGITLISSMKKAEIIKKLEDKA